MALILVVDDDPSVRRTLQRVLEGLQHRVLLALDGAEGLRMWREHGADLVMLDIHMPELDGIEALVQLRAFGPSVPVVMMSGGGQSDRLDLLGDATLLGAWAVLAKPFSLDEVVRVVTRTLANADTRGDTA